MNATVDFGWIKFKNEISRLHVVTDFSVDRRMDDDPIMAVTMVTKRNGEFAFGGNVLEEVIQDAVTLGKFQRIAEVMRDLSELSRKGKANESNVEDAEYLIHVLTGGKL